MAVVAYPGTPGTVLYGGLPTPSDGTALTTITLANTSATEQSAGFVSPMFGLPLKQGDVPAGQYPAFELAGGTPVPASFGKYPARWPDGSMRHVPVLLRVPASIPGSGSLSVTVKNGGSEPAPSALTAASVAAASDLKVPLNALKNWTAGEWVSAVNQGITDGDVWVFADGPAGTVLRVYEGFRQAGADHGQAGIWHYVQALQNASGGLYGLRHLGKFANGWHDVVSPQINTLVADAVTLKNGATTIRNIAPLAAARTFSWSSGFTAANVTNLVNGMAVRLSTTGTLPAGLSADTAYFARLTGGNGFTLHNSIEGVEFNNNLVTATDGGTGTHTLTPVLHLEAYAAGPYTVGADGEYDFIQAGGTGAECTVRVEVDRAYRKATKIFGPIRTDVTPTALDVRSYNIDTYWDAVTNQDGTGERPDIGYITGWCTRHWMRGDGFKTIRTYTLQQNLKAWSLRRSATKNPLNLSNSTYTGLGAAMPDYRYRPSNSAANSGVNAPADYFKTRGAQDWAHQPHFLGYAYAMSGEPQFLDALHDMAIAAVANQGDRSPTVSGTTYRSIVLRTEGQRVEAWALREVAWAAMLTPDTYLGAPIGTYFKDILASNFDYLKAEKLTGSTFAQANKFYPSTSTNQAPWGVAYLLTAFNIAYTATGDADALAAINDIIASFDAVRQNVGLHTVSSYYMHFIGGPKATTSWDDVLFEDIMKDPGLTDQVSFSAATDMITATPVTGYGSLAADAPVLVIGNAPGGLTNGSRYYMRDTTGTTFKLADTKGGAAKDIATTGANGSGQWAAKLSGVSNTTMAGGVAQKSYPAMIVAGMKWSKALGATVPAGFESAVETFYGVGPTFTDDPVYALDEAF